MAFRFKPVEREFYGLLGGLAEYLVEGGELVAAMLGDDNDRKGIAVRMRETERNADDATHAVVRKLSNTFVTPFDREDIYALASALDDVMDDMDEAVDLALLYDIEHLPSEFADLITVIQRCADLTAEAMPRLRHMQQLGEYWIEVNRLENSGARAYRRILAHLFSGSYGALEVLKLQGVLEALQRAVDGFERVANIIEQISVKES